MFIVCGKAKVKYTFCQVGESRLFQQRFIGLSSPELGTCKHVFMLSRARLDDGGCIDLSLKQIAKASSCISEGGKYCIVASRLCE